jgi:hypothetical protein
MAPRRPRATTSRRASPHWSRQRPPARATRNAARHQKPLAMLRFTGRAVLDGLVGLVGRQPVLVPLAGEPGTVALLTTAGRPRWRQSARPGRHVPGLAAGGRRRSALRVTFYRLGRYASRVRYPLLVLVCDQDQSALAAPPSGCWRTAEPPRAPWAPTASASATALMAPSPTTTPAPGSCSTG